MVKCEQCGVELYRSPEHYYHKLDEKYFCSPGCVYEHLGMEEVEQAHVESCSVCGEVLAPEEWETYKVAGEYFCSKDCIELAFEIKYTAID